MGQHFVWRRGIVAKASVSHSQVLRFDPRPALVGVRGNLVTDDSLKRMKHVTCNMCY